MPSIKKFQSMPTKNNNNASGGGGAGGHNGLTLEEEQALMNQPAVRSILGFAERYDRAEMQELLSQMNCHWLLSTEDFKIPIENPVGLISQMPPLNEDHVILLVPYDESIKQLDYRELHQIIRELTIGMYVLNQHPGLQLEANFDESTTCQLPPAYLNTRLGQVMINADYWLKSLWHGSYFPREKRIKFSERWRQMLDVDANGIAQTKKSIIGEFIAAGLTDISKDPDYADIYVTETPDTTLKTFGLDLGDEYRKKPLISSHLTDSEYTDFNEMTDQQLQEEMNFFMNHVEDIQIQMTFSLDAINRHRNLYEIQSDYLINGCCKASNDRIDNLKYERLKKRLYLHEKFLRKHYARKKEVRKYLNLLKIVSFLVPFFIGLKKRMKIPDLNNLLPSISGDEIHTERELPPLMLGADFKSANFAYANSENGGGKYFNLHGGIQFELETCAINTNALKDFDSEYERISALATDALKHYLQAEQQQEYQIPIVEMNNKKYWCIRIDIDSYYPQFPQKPFWISKLNEDLVKLKPKRFPMTDIQIYDYFKRHCGYKRATKYKNPQAGLRASAQRGMISIFQYFARKTPTNHLAKHDEYGMGLMHYAAIFNKPLVATTLIINTVDANIKQQIDYLAIGPMPLHYAARTCSLDAMSCLISNFANISYADHDGWAPIHHAAYFDNVSAIRLLARKQHELIDLSTRNDLRRTPILCAASAGSLEAVKCLISLGANLMLTDENNNNLINIAAHRGHTNIIDYFIGNKYPQLNAWKILIEMLEKNNEDKESSTRCLNVLTNQNKAIWPSIISSGGTEKLVSLLRKYSTIISPAQPEDEKNNETSTNSKNNKKQQQQSKSSIKINEATNTTSAAAGAMSVKFAAESESSLSKEGLITLNALSVLCNLSDELEVKKKLCEIKDLPAILIKILQYSSNEDILSRVSILLGDIFSVEDSLKPALDEEQCLSELISLLGSDLEDLLVNSVNAIEIICRKNYKTQRFCCRKGIYEIFMNLLNYNSELLRSSVAAAIASISYNNYENQMCALHGGVIEPLVDLYKSRNMTVQLKISMAIESLAFNNQNVQNLILSLDAVENLIRLLEIKTNMEDWSVIIREQAALTLWSLAGSSKPQRRLIAEKIGITQILSMLLSKSEKLQYVGCKCMIALVLENLANQNRILEESGIDPLIRLLKLSTTSHRVIAATVDTIGALCVDIAHVNNEQTQRELIDKGALELLTHLLEVPFNKEIQINTAHALACLLLNQPEERLVDIDYSLNLKFMLDLVDIDDNELRLRAGLAITVLAYNNKKKQQEILDIGGISFNFYRAYFEEDGCSLMQLCEACFQIVVLARVINDRDQVWLTALGITKLVSLLLSDEDQVVIQSASYLSSLAHTRSGITDAMITCDAVDILCDLLYASNDQIKFASAITLGYLTFNRTASRLLLHNCRNTPKLFNRLMSLHKNDEKISRQFIESYHAAISSGLPILVNNNSNSKLFRSTKEFVGSRTNNNNNKDIQERPRFYQEKTMISMKSAPQFATVPVNRSQSAPMSKQIAKANTFINGGNKTSSNNNNNRSTTKGGAHNREEEQQQEAEDVDGKKASLVSTSVTAFDGSKPTIGLKSTRKKSAVKQH